MRNEVRRRAGHNGVVSRIAKVLGHSSVTRGTFRSTKGLIVRRRPRKALQLKEMLPERTLGAKSFHKSFNFGTVMVGYCF